MCTLNYSGLTLQSRARCVQPVIVRVQRAFRLSLGRVINFSLFWTQVSKTSRHQSTASVETGAGVVRVRTLRTCSRISHVLGLQAQPRQRTAGKAGMHQVRGVQTWRHVFQWPPGKGSQLPSPSCTVGPVGTRDAGKRLFHVRGHCRRGATSRLAIFET